MFNTAEAAADWNDCKAAHQAATDMWEAQGAWRPDTVKPWLDDLAERARAFKARHGIEFDPKNPIVKTTEERV